MQEKWGFDKTFLKEKIKIGEIVLNNRELFDPKEIQNYGLMVSKFKEYLHIKPNEKEIKVTTDIILQDLNKKMSEDIGKLGLQTWTDIKKFCENVPEVDYPINKTNLLDDNPASIKKEVIKFYRKIDRESLSIVKKILNPEEHLINIDPTLSSHCFPCLALNKTFINIKDSGDDRYISTIHEIQHAIDQLINDFKVSYLFKETAPMFMETLFIDNLNKKRNNKYSSLYGVRIENNYSVMKLLKDYVNFLELFKKYDCNIDLTNIDKILLVDDAQDLKRKYHYLMRYKYQECYAYVNSFFTSLELRNMYYNSSKKEALKLLKKYISGMEDVVYRDRQLEEYQKFMIEINGKGKHYVAKHLK